jgi:hypothetical protein
VPQGVEEGGDHQGGGDHGQGGPLAGKEYEHLLREDDGAEVECDEHGRQRGVDDSAIYDAVYVVEAVAEDGDASGHRNSGDDDEGVEHPEQDR